MSCDFRSIKNFEKALEKAGGENEKKFIREVLISEGELVVKNAKTIAKNENIVDTGLYRNSFHTGRAEISRFDGTEETENEENPPYDGNIKHNSDTYEIEVYNNVEYAIHLEDGFRSHFVPGTWQGNIFIYDKNSDTGMYVGGKNEFVPGKFVLKRAEEAAQNGQNERIRRKLYDRLRPYLEGK